MSNYISQSAFGNFLRPKSPLLTILQVEWTKATAVMVIKVSKTKSAKQKVSFTVRCLATTNFRISLSTRTSKHALALCESQHNCFLITYLFKKSFSMGNIENSSAAFQRVGGLPAVMLHTSAVFAAITDHSVEGDRWRADK